jgi:thiamine-phosphate pyrophosphorylase
VKIDVVDGRIGFDIYLITDRNGCAGRDLLTVVGKALEGGIRAVQLREKDLPARDLYNLASEMRELTGRFGARLFINDRIDIAMTVDADGVHLGESGIPADLARKLLGKEKLIGVSCHSLESALSARKRGADFITCGPVFHTPSKAAYGEPIGLPRLAEVASSINIPVFAIGGIKRGNIGEVMAAGAKGIALISAVIAAADPKVEAEILLSLIGKQKE